MSGAGQAVAFAEITWRGRPVRIEYQWLGSEDPAAPLIVFLHEGLGSLSMWRDFPARLCAAAGARGLVWSRPGYGRSTPRQPDETWDVDFMHRQAHEVMPAFFDALGLDAVRPWLFGHSDGGTIALLHAARWPERVAGLVVLAPHIFVEDVSVSSIHQARHAYQSQGLKQRLARHHDDPDSAFWGWYQAWVNPEFRSWSIEDELVSIRCPVLAVQGLQDEYGTLEQIRGIARLVPQTRLLELPDCGHSPHKDQADVLVQETVAFMSQFR